MNVTNNFFIVSGQAFKEEYADLDENTYHLNFTSTIYPLDSYGNYIWVGNPLFRFGDITFLESSLKSRMLQEQDANSTLEPDVPESDMDTSGQRPLPSEKLHITTKSTVEIFCPKDSEVCDRNIFIFYPEINHNNYKLEIELDTGHLNSEFKAFTFSAVTANSRYTMFLLLLRYSLFIISVLMGSRYFKFYWAMNNFMKTFEHKAIFWLSIFLIFFNDPFYAATILKSNIFFSILSTLFVCVFLSFMILFWIVMLQRIHKEPATPETKIFNTKSTKLLGNPPFCLTTRHDHLHPALRKLLDCLGGQQNRPELPS